MNRLRNRLILVFLAATLAPLFLTLWTTVELLQYSRDKAPLRELDESSRSLEKVGREFYRHACDSLRSDAHTGRVAPHRFSAAQRSQWPTAVAEFWDSSDMDRCDLAGADGDQLQYLERHEGEVRVYSQALGIGMGEVRRRYARAREALDTSRRPDLRRGFLFVATATWLVAFVVLVYWAHRISRPIRQLTQGLGKVAAGDLTTRVEVQRDDEIGTAIRAFNHMADQLQQARERLIHVTRLASWQALARKMAHEVKNSLTPIRLTMEELVARHNENDRGFLLQAAQIIVDEVITLERRVRAFSEFAAEPPVSPAEIDVNALVEERISFLKAAHPEVLYNLRLAREAPKASADPDLIKGVLTNLLENAAEAARAGGVVLALTTIVDGKVFIEVHDSGPGLSLQSRSTLFEPSISFKKGGMGLGLSIARRSALLCGGDITLIQSELGGAGFRITLPVVAAAEGTPAAMMAANERE